MRRPDGSCRLIRRHPGLDQPGFETPPNAQIKEPMQVHLGTDGSLELVSDFCRPVPTSLVPPGAPWRPLAPPGAPWCPSVATRRIRFAMTQFRHQNADGVAGVAVIITMSDLSAYPMAFQ